MQVEQAHIDVHAYTDPVISCEQCGMCSSACPLTGEDGFNIRRIERAVQLGLGEQVAGTRLPWLCAACGRCEAACPNGYRIMTTVRALRTLTPPEVRPEMAPCREACPAHVDAPLYVRLIAQGRLAEAYSVIRERVPFPGILGRVCARPCETSCKRAEVNDAISICALKRYAADRAGEAREAAAGNVKDDTGRKVAVVGAGPTGLTAAYYLRKQGHAVKVLEVREQPGGMMRYGIPSYRLPEEVLDEEIGQVLGIGVELETGKRLGEDFTIEQLQEGEEFDAVFLAMGAQQSRKVKLEGADHEDVLWGVEFLAEAREKDGVDLKDRVVVVGGGNVAVDVALTAFRSGAGEVSMVSLEDREEMPAFAWEIEEALEEGVEVLPTWGPSKIIHQDGKVSGVELVHCTSVFDDSGAFCPVFGEEKKVLEADQVILAIGQQTDLSFLPPEGPIETIGGLIEVDLQTQKTAAGGVWAGGDAAAKGPGTPGTVIEAIAAGRRAAEAIDRALGGDGDIEESLSGESLRQGDGLPEYTGEREEGFADWSRIHVPAVPAEERSGSFVEVAQCYAEDQAVVEAGRCLQCDLEIAMIVNGSESV